MIPVKHSNEGAVLENGIGFIATRGIALVKNHSIRDALAAAYHSSHGLRAVDIAHRVFKRLVSVNWPKDTLCRFISGWHSMHGTSLFVSGLMIRLQREATKVSGPRSITLHQAAAEVGEIIPEDTGVDDIPHNERFDLFANQLIGNDNWKLNCYAMPACLEFRRYVKQQRLTASIEEAILTTAASENWNAGEYTHLNALVRPWMINCLGQSVDVVEEKVAYVAVHAGETELGHFLHALNAWQLYCKANGNEADPAKAKRVLENYLNRIADAFVELEQVFVD